MYWYYKYPLIIILIALLFGTGVYIWRSSVSAYFEKRAEKVANHQWQWRDFSPVQQSEYARLPESFKQNASINGHMASHQLLVDDFCTAVFYGKMPAVNAWQAARWTIPGLLAHQSALLDGKAMDVPDCGEAPK